MDYWLAHKWSCCSFVGGSVPACTNMEIEAGMICRVILHMKDWQSNAALQGWNSSRCLDHLPRCFLETEWVKNKTCDSRAIGWNHFHCKTTQKRASLQILVAHMMVGAHVLGRVKVMMFQGFQYILFVEFLKFVPARSTLPMNQSHNRHAAFSKAFNFNIISVFASVLVKSMATWLYNQYLSSDCQLSKPQAIASGQVQASTCVFRQLCNDWV